MTSSLNRRISLKEIFILNRHGYESRSLVPALFVMPLFFCLAVFFSSADHSLSAALPLAAPFLILAVDLPHQIWTPFRARDLLMQGRLSLSELSPVFYLWLAAGIAAACVSTVSAFTVLAYFTIHHNVRQQAGWLARSQTHHDIWEKISKSALQASMVLGVLYWHVAPIAPGFLVSGDLFYFKNALSPELVRMGAIVCGFLTLAIELFRIRQNTGVERFLVVIGSLLPWVVAITLLQDRLLFGLTNILVHSLPYIAAVEIQRQPLKKQHSYRWIFIYMMGLMYAWSYTSCGASIANDLFSAKKLDSGIDIFHPIELFNRIAASLVVLLPLLHYFSDSLLWRSHREHRF